MVAVHRKTHIALTLQCEGYIRPKHKGLKKLFVSCNGPTKKCTKVGKFLNTFLGDFENHLNLVMLLLIG